MSADPTMPLGISLVEQQEVEERAELLDAREVAGARSCSNFRKNRILILSSSLLIAAVVAFAIVERLGVDHSPLKQHGWAVKLAEHPKSNSVNAIADKIQANSTGNQDHSKSAGHSEATQKPDDTPKAKTGSKHDKDLANSNDHDLATKKTEDISTAKANSKNDNDGAKLSDHNVATKKTEDTPKAKTNSKNDKDPAKSTNHTAATNKKDEPNNNSSSEDGNEFTTSNDDKEETTKNDNKPKDAADSNKGKDPAKSADHKDAGKKEDKPHKMPEKCNTRFLCPPKPANATQYNGVKLDDVCFHDSGAHHVFLIGDWGGIAQKDGTSVPAIHVNNRWQDEKNFVWPTDSQAQYRVRDQMRARAYKSRPDYILNVGDDFYWAGVNDRCGAPDITKRYSLGGNTIHKDTPVDQFQKQFEEVYTGNFLDGKQWLGVLGNHDWGGWLFNSAWDQIIGYTWVSPRWVQPSLYYQVKVWYPDVSVDYYFLDTNTFDALEPPNTSPHNICSQQHNEDGASCAPVGPSGIWECQKWFQSLWGQQKWWLDQVVPKSTADWRIVVTHFPPYWGESEWQELVKKHEFDLIITGHRHLQNTHKPGDPPKMIWANDPNKLMDDFLDPVAWVVTGGGGGITSEHAPENNGQDDQYGFMDLTIAKDFLTIDAISHGGILRRSMKIEHSFKH